ncbi:MAG: heme o synthase [Pseudomonadota bacterium]|jgi:protoheme IX farnesyltransferase|nr:heme o synthase [Alphaproteobacteria bacterium]MEC7702323.1 heme o synthase [Pseudomonadota bacterium]MED5422376.1 heme o synthase [Pseudomonadota bacterium]
MNTSTSEIVEPQSSPQQDASVRDYWQLLKPRVMSLVVFSGFVGLWIAPGREDMHPALAAIAILCLAVGAGASGAINMWYDRDIDRVMKRTKNRPIPLGRILPEDALGFALVLSVLSITVLALATNYMAAGVLAFASFFYAVIYTMLLKRSTAQNIVIGGAAGAFPPVVGWVSVTGQLDPMAFWLFMIIFLWTPPHFWALALVSNEDYKKAKIPMMPLVAGDQSTRVQMLVYAAILLAVSLVPWFMGYAGLIYGVSALVLGGLFLVSSIKVLLDKSDKAAKLMFGYSILYLFLLFFALMVDHG